MLKAISRRHHGADTVLTATARCIPKPPSPRGTAGTLGIGDAPCAWWADAGAGQLLRTQGGRRVAGVRPAPGAGV